MSADRYPMKFAGDYVNSEIDAINIRARNRLKTDDVKYIVIHSSATPPSKSLSLEELYDQHVGRQGLTNIGYHYYIRRDGTRHQTRELTEVGAHCKPWNSCSIGICYEGGIRDDGKPGCTFTLAQENAIRDLLKALLSIYPTAVVRGHRDMPGATDEDCPGFNAELHFRLMKNEELRIKN